MLKVLEPGVKSPEFEKNFLSDFASGSLVTVAQWLSD